MVQLGITLMMPILLCIAFCFWLCDAFDVGVWVYLPGILFGLGGSVMSGYKFYLSVMKKHNKKEGEQKKPVAFNDHI